MATGAGGGGLDGTAAPAVDGTGKVVRAFLRGGGARVLVPSRGEAALGALRTQLGGGDGCSVPVASVQARRRRAGAPA